MSVFLKYLIIEKSHKRVSTVLRRGNRKQLLIPLGVVKMLGTKRVDCTEVVVNAFSAIELTVKQLKFYVT